MKIKMLMQRMIIINHENEDDEYIIPNEEEEDDTDEDEDINPDAEIENELNIDEMYNEHLYDYVIAQASQTTRSGRASKASERLDYLWHHIFTQGHK